MVKMFYRKKFLEKAAAIKKHEHSQLRSELNQQTDIAKKYIKE